MEPFLSPEDAPLDYEETLRELLGLLDKPVEVVVGDGSGEPVLVVTMNGTLLRSTNLAINPDIPEQEAQFFIVREGETAGFLVHAGTFQGGQPIPHGVRFLAGAVLVSVTSDDL